MADFIWTASADTVGSPVLEARYGEPCTVIGDHLAVYGRPGT